MRDHTKLRAFELADEVAILIYRATRVFPKEEVYANRCPNLDRRAGPRGRAAARRQAPALHHQFGLARRLEYVDESSAPLCDAKIVEAEKVLSALIRSMRKT